MTTEEENDLICEVILGWKLCTFIDHVSTPLTVWMDGDRQRPKTHLDDWESAGLLIEAMVKRSFSVTVDCYRYAGRVTWFACFTRSSDMAMYSSGAAEVYSGLPNTGPIAVRKAVLKYLASEADKSRVSTGGVVVGTPK
jgi:hypothetical protein